MGKNKRLMKDRDIRFKDSVFETVARIPEGRVATYGQIALLAGRPGAARAVGNALHTNDDPVRVPCHRVVDACGRPGANYGLGGPVIQRRRLEDEGVVFSENGSVDLTRYGIVIENHPLQPFLPPNGKMLFLGSFPPPRARWSMEFFYPNFINDFWRILGLLFFGDKKHFEVPGAKRFDVDRVKAFCSEAGLGFYDTASKVCRWKGNASDEFLEIIEPADIAALLAAMPSCRTVVTTGGKSSEELLAILAADGASICGSGSVPASSGDGPAAAPFGVPPVGDNLDISCGDSGLRVPPVGGSIAVRAFGRDLRWYRMPSSSRAYPMSLDRKAEYYLKLFSQG